MLVVVDLGQLN